MGDEASLYGAEGVLPSQPSAALWSSTRVKKRQMLQRRRLRPRLCRRRTVAFSEFVRPHQRLRLWALAARGVRCPMRHVHSSPCYESPVHLASTQSLSIFELDLQYLRPTVSSDARPLGFAAYFEQSEVDELASTDDCQFRLPPPIGPFLQSGRTADLSNDACFPFLRRFPPHPT